MPHKVVCFLLLALSLFLPDTVLGRTSPIPEEDFSIWSLSNSSATIPEDSEFNCPQIWGSDVETDKYAPTIQVYSNGSYFQWQISRDHGKSWSDLQDDDTYSGTKSHVLHFKKVDQSMKDDLYRLKISNNQCSVLSETFHFKLGQIQQHPEDQCVQPYQQAVFTGSGIGDGVSYRWQANYGGHWFDLIDDEYYSGTHTNRLVVKSADPYWMNQHRFRLDVTVRDGFTISSQPATLYIGKENCPAPAVNKWTGARDRHWNNSANWSLNQVPSLDLDAIIPTGLQRYPLIQEGAVATAKDLIVESGASVEINQQWLMVSGTLSVAGVIQAPQGKLGMVGSQPQLIPNNVLQNSRLGDLMIQNTSGVTLEGPVGISRSVLVQEGVLYSNGRLRLLSDASGTALIVGSGRGTIAGKVIMQHYLDRAFGYKYLSTPFKDLRVGDFAPFIDLDSPFPSFYAYKEDHKDANGDHISGWVTYTDPANSLAPMLGYALNFGTGGSPLTLELSGSVNQGPFSQRLNNTSGTFTQGFHLVGNPYPSPIDWDGPGWTKNNIDSGIYFFQASEDDQYGGSYTSYVSGISSDGTGTASSVIPAMEGFFVHVSDPLRPGETTYGELGMTDAVRVNPYNQRIRMASFSTTPTRSLLRLSAQLDSGSKADQMVVYFSHDGTESFDGTMDALKLLNTDSRIPNFYSLSAEGKKVSIKASANLDSQDKRIPLGITSESSGSMTVSLQDMENFPSGLKVFFIDREKKRVTNLLQSPYSFFVNQGVHENRFELLISSDNQALEPRAFEEPFSAHPGRGTLRIDLNPTVGNKAMLQVYAISGNLIHNRQLNGELSVEMSLPGAGVYIVVLDDDGKSFTKKVLVK